MEAQQQNEAQERAKKDAEAQWQIEAQERRKREEHQPQVGAQGQSVFQPGTREGSHRHDQEPQKNTRSSVVWASIVMLGLVILGLTAIGLMNLLPPLPLSPALVDTKPSATQTAKPVSNNLALPPASARLGDTWISPVDGMELAYIPAGEFQMGCDPKLTGGMICQDDALPLHKVTLDAFYIDKTEVSNSQYAICVAVGACDAPEDTSSYSRSTYYGDSSFANYPVICVSRQDASDYCAWAGRELPTEAQWEKAARGDTPRAYPWGDEKPSCELLNGVVDGNMCEGDTTEVGSHPLGASPYGVLDMAGNVWEWVSDWYSNTYYGSLEEFINPTGPATGTSRVFRGGSFYDYVVIFVRASSRYYVYPINRDHVIGFRCAVSPAP